MVKDLGSLNGVSESLLKTCLSAQCEKEPALVLPIGPRAESPPPCVQGRGPQVVALSSGKWKPWFGPTVAAALPLCSGIFPLFSSERKPVIVPIKVFRGSNCSRTNQSRTAELESCPAFLFSVQWLSSLFRDYFKWVEHFNVWWIATVGLSWLTFIQQIYWRPDGDNVKGLYSKRRNSATSLCWSDLFSLLLIALILSLHYTTVTNLGTWLLSINTLSRSRPD